VPRPNGFRAALAALLLAAAFDCAPLGLAAAWADDTPQSQLDAVQKQIEQNKQQQATLAQQSAALAAEINQLRSQQIAAAQSTQAHEQALTRLDTQLASLAAQLKAKSAELDKRRGEQATVLMALLRLARNPPIGLALTDGTPVDVLRGGILMGAAVPPLVERAQRLGIELQTLADLKNQLQDAETQHRTEADGLAKEQARLAALATQKAGLQKQASAGAAATGQQIQKLAAQAGDLRDLIARAEAEERAREAEEKRQREAAAAEAAAAARLAAKQAQMMGNNAVPPHLAAVPVPSLADPSRPATLRTFSQAMGHVMPPTVGDIVVAYGGPGDAGVSSKGITFETRPGAEVVAPFDGRVVFAGTFKGYGQILIIGHGDGYHSLVAGLDRIDSSVGQWLVAGEPIGSMPAGEAKPRLYLELRHDGQPINPLPWLATRDAKVKG
jgi:septal ring factor EnvC (AmiA/AmiB activator)